MSKCRVFLALNKGSYTPMTDQTATSPPRRARPKVMTLTPRAAERVRAIMASKGPEVAGLKIGIKKGGCAGMEYTMTWADSVGKFDEVIEQDGRA